MLSIAGRNHQKLHHVRPLNTPDRIRMYHSIDVEVPRSQKIIRAPMQTIGRQKRDSFILKNSCQMVINTNYKINEQLVHESSPKNSFAKYKFKRIIGDVRDEDFSVALNENCSHRCIEANKKLPYQQKLLSTRDTHKMRAQHHNVDFDKQLNHRSIDFKNLPSYMKKDRSIFSTLDSENNMQEDKELRIKKRNNSPESFETHHALKKIRKFENFIGHKYGEQLFKPKKIPELYDIQQSNESLIKKSMSKPKGNMKFDRYRSQIRTRLDRQDPLWGMSVNYEDSHENPQWKHSSNYKTVDFEKMADRQPNQVYSKYAIRQAMSLNIPQNRC